MVKSNPQNQLKLSQLKIVIAVAEHQSFGEAALALNISQSAVSHAIAALETSLGVVIFSRGRYGAVLTPVGSRILPHAQSAVSSSAAILKEAAAAKGLEQGKVRVASFRSMAAQIVPQAIKQLRERFPGIITNVTEHESAQKVAQALRAGQADIGILTLPTAPDMTAWELLEDEFVVLLPPETQLQSDELSWDELVKQPLIMPPVSHPMMRPVYDHINSRGYWLSVVNEIETDAATVSLVAQGVGGTILPRLAAEPIPDNVQVFSLPVPLVRKVGIAILSEALHPPAVYAMLDTLKDLFTEAAVES